MGGEEMAALGVLEGLGSATCWARWCTGEREDSGSMIVRVGSWAAGGGRSDSGSLKTLLVWVIGQSAGASSGGRARAARRGC